MFINATSTHQISMSMHLVDCLSVLRSVWSGLEIRCTIQLRSLGQGHSLQLSGMPAPHWWLPLLTSQSMGCYSYFDTIVEPALLTPAIIKVLSLFNNPNCLNYIASNCNGNCNRWAGMVSWSTQYYPGTDEYTVKLWPFCQNSPPQQGLKTDTFQTYVQYTTMWSSVKDILMLTKLQITMHILTALFSRSTLFPRTTNGKFSGSLGDACIRNSSRQLSRDLNVFGADTSKTRTQQSAPR